MSIQLRIADCSKETAGYLKDLLIGKGIAVKIGEEADATVCYGYGGVRGPRVLNGKAGTFDNLQQITTLRDAGIPIPNCYTRIADAMHAKFPLFARSSLHREGKDIKPVFQPEELAWRKAAGATFFTEFVPHTKEYRVWTFRNEVLATYVKKMEFPEKYKHIGKTFQNGFVTVFTDAEDVPVKLRDLAIQATKAVGLDFAGVDILHGKDGRYYVLEANSAPGANGPGAVGISKLASRIKTWINAGYPARA
jgi:tetrahydromethanopterin:alpha-L-glutamate ligase